MKLRISSYLVALAAVPLLAAVANAQLTVQAPFTQVQVGPGQVRVLAPFVRVQVIGAPPPLLYTAPTPLVAVPMVPAQALPAGVSAQTPAEFAGNFKPMPGSYEAILLHPFTLQPVKVCFTLPRTQGNYWTRVRPRLIQFDSPDHVVEIRFLRNGQVEVDKY
jgi:hypothetical protein